MHIRLAHVIVIAYKGYDSRHGASLYDRASNKKLIIWSAFIFSVQKNSKSLKSVIIVLKDVGNLIQTTSKFLAVTLEESLRELLNTFEIEISISEK